MSSGCGDVLTLEDLKTAKKHQVFEAEVITGKSGGVANGADIDYATNQVTGQVQKTLPAVLRDAGFKPASFTFATGGTLGVNDANVAVLYPTEGQYYIWHGALPKVIPASSSPATTGGISSTGWVPWGDMFLRGNLAAVDGRKLIGKCATIAALRTTEPTYDKQWIDVEKYWTDSLAPQGTYWYDASDTTSADNGGTIIVTAGGKRWKFKGKPTVETYGAYGDGAHDDADSIRSCISSEDVIVFSTKTYLLLSSFQPVRSKQIFEGNNAKLESTFPSGMNGIIEYSLNYREGVQYKDMTFASRSAGTGSGIYSPSSIYVANSFFKNVSFEASLAVGINANIISCEIHQSRFGLEGTVGASFQAIRSSGQAPQGSNLTTNNNYIKGCRFFRSNSAYCVDFVNGVHIVFQDCDFETNTNSAGCIRVAGILSVYFRNCWWERSGGRCLVKIQMDSVGNLQGVPVVSFDGCWIKLEASNTEVVYSDTVNTTLAFTNCCGTGYAGRNLFMINTSANHLGYLRDFANNYFVGFSLFPQNTNFAYEMGTSLLELRDTAGTKHSTLSADSNRVLVQHDLGLALRTQTGGVYILEVVLANGATEIRGRDANGAIYKLRVPTGGGAATWVAA